MRGEGEIHAYRSFAALVAELDSQLAAGRVLLGIDAYGAYNATTEELTTHRGAFRFAAPETSED